MFGDETLIIMGRRGVPKRVDQRRTVEGSGYNFNSDTRRSLYRSYKRGM